MARQKTATPTPAKYGQQLTATAVAKAAAAQQTTDAVCASVLATAKQSGQWVGLPKTEIA